LAVGWRSRAVATIVGCILASSGAGVAGDTTFDLSGRVSPQIVVMTYPDDSALRDVFGSSSIDLAFDARVIFGARSGRWSFDTDYQLVGLYADRLEFTRELPEELQILFPHLPDDRTRLFDLTHVFADSGKTAVYHRLDRLAVRYASEHVVLKFGRQAITWGNGLVFNVMDIFNPFDPAAVDKEFKTGDDMLYGQYLLADGNDVQGVMVFRRDPLTGDVEADQGSLAFKYHHMASISEYDAVVAEHFGDTLVGAGANVSIGGSVWRGDVMLTFTDDDTVPSLLTSLSHSWTWAGTNVSGLAEYFYNGFGQSDGCYSFSCLAENTDLLERISRGEVFNLGRHYLGLSGMIEVTPLFLLTPNVFFNITDPSALLQVVFQNDLMENLLLWSAINLPVGANGTEFGGAATEIPGVYLSSGPSASVQLVWYW
jgi:hypothetical protein